MINIIIFLSIAVAFLAVGFARQEEPTVTVPLQSSVRYRGESYHPHSEGVEMPISHAKALGFSEDQFLGEEPDEEEDTGESKSDGDSEGDDSSGESESDEESKENEDSQSDEQAYEEDAAQSADQEAIEEAEAEQGDEPDEELEPIPDDTPEYDELIKDERFATVEALLENQDQLTDINGIAEKTAAKVVDHVKSYKEG
ncbi:hypothetical protein [Fodinibius sp.]|uniref:hypothetical protein n=1 Tax=Fodinibius sp. TaxID=1872440 RepID=UPI002ACE1573|nr:hypothetical protein [Fodinibius sp.]MDZ7658075.1 hypothetical protein [Fodinibius sp.]